VAEVKIGDRHQIVRQNTSLLVILNQRNLEPVTDFSAAGIKPSALINTIRVAGRNVQTPGGSLLPGG
jgi:hypothetical protein